MLGGSLLALLLSVSLSTNADGDVQVSGNPYMTDTCPSDRCKCPAQSLNPLSVVVTPLVTQSYTFSRIVHKKFMGMDLPIYHFNQPERLSRLQLAFRILPVYTIDETGVIDIPVEHAKGADSWFSGYTWSILVCTLCEERTHLGWRYTPNSSNNSQGFIGLIVSYSESTELKTAAGSILEDKSELAIGSPAPEWMIAAAATIAESSSRSTLRV